MSDFKNIPKLSPAQFDEYFFGSWKPDVSGFYELFHIERIENYKAFLNLPVLPHRRSVYFFLFVTKGFAVRSKGLTKFKVEANSFFFLSTDQITALEEISEDIEGFYCHFKPEIFNFNQLSIVLETDFPFFSITAEPLIKVENTERINYLLEILYNESKRNESQRRHLIAIYLIACLNEVKLFDNQQISEVNNAATLLTKRYKLLLAEQIYQLKTVTEYAERLAVSPNHLHKCVKTVTGKSAHELLDDMRILEAKVLLKQTPLRIAEIAFRIGDFEPSDFSRFFKSKTGMTPKTYRNTLH